MSLNVGCEWPDDDRALLCGSCATRALETALALADRCEATQGQKFYDQVKPEWEALSAALSPNVPGQRRAASRSKL